MEQIIRRTHPNNSGGLVGVVSRRSGPVRALLLRVELAPVLHIDVLRLGRVRARRRNLGGPHGNRGAVKVVPQREAEHLEERGREIRVGRHRIHKLGGAL